MTPPAATMPSSNTPATLEEVAVRLARVALAAGSDGAMISHLFEMAAGRLTILTASLSTEAASGALGQRAIATQDTMAQETMAVSGIRRAFRAGQTQLAHDLAALQRPEATIDLSLPYRSRLDGLFMNLCRVEDRLAALATTVQDPLRRVAATLDHLGVRIVLGATNVDAMVAARIAQYSRRLKELAHLFSNLIGAIDIYLQGILSSLGGLHRDLALAGAQLVTTTATDGAAVEAVDSRAALEWKEQYQSAEAVDPAQFQRRPSFWATLLASKTQRIRP